MKVVNLLSTFNAWSPPLNRWSPLRLWFLFRDFEHNELLSMSLSSLVSFGMWLHQPGAFSSVWKLFHRLCLISHWKGSCNHHPVPVQVILRWLAEKEVSFVVRSYNRTRLEENFNAVDGSLADADIQRLDSIPDQRKAVTSQMFVQPEHGPFKTLKDIWDERLLWSPRPPWGLELFYSLVQVDGWRLVNPKIVVL